MSAIEQLAGKTREQQAQKEYTDFFTEAQTRERKLSNFNLPSRVDGLVARAQHTDDTRIRFDLTNVLER